MSANGAKAKRTNQEQKHTVVSREEWIAARKKSLKSDHDQGSELTIDTERIR